MNKIDVVHIQMGKWEPKVLNTEAFGIHVIKVPTWEAFCQQRSQIQQKVYSDFGIPTPSFATTIREATSAISTLGQFHLDATVRKVVVVSEDGWPDKDSDTGVLDVVRCLVGTSEWRIHSQQNGVLTCVLSKAEHTLERDGKDSVHEELLRIGVDIIVDARGAKDAGWFIHELKQRFLVTARRLEWDRESFRSGFIFATIAFFVFGISQALANRIFKEAPWRFCASFVLILCAIYMLRSGKERLS